jgi:hypothetical protein
MAPATGHSQRFQQFLGYGKGRPHVLKVTLNHSTSDQAPGEETVQVNDKYTGGGPPPDPGQSENGQHQTGG